MLEITLQDGTTRTVNIQKFPALDGWGLQREFIDFSASTDNQFRRGYVLKVLQYASIPVGDNDMFLKTDAVIDNHLGTWENVELVFTEILKKNGVDPDTHAANPGYWEEAGSKMAISFIAEAAKLMGPAFMLAKG